MAVAKIAAAGLLVILATGPREFGIGGGAVLCVPEENLVLESLPYGSKHLEVGGGRTPGFSFSFNVAEIERSVPGFSVDPRLEGLREASKLTGSLGFLDETDRRHAAEKWLRHEVCHALAVEPVAGTTLYRARCDKEQNAALLLDRRPDLGSDLPETDDRVVATCRYETLRLGRYSGDELRSCTRVTLIDGFLVSYQFQERNAGFIPVLDKFLTDKIAEWRDNCHAARRL